MAKPIQPSAAGSRPTGSVDINTFGDVALLNVAGLIDERFQGFGTVGAVKVAIINVAGITRMTSFGVRQWLKAMDALPRAVELYLLGCPTFFVDQLNMVLNFGGAAKVLTVIAPHTCPSCGVESGEMIDVLTERNNLLNGVLPEKDCARCGGRLEFDETPESYFSFIGKYGASAIPPEAAEVLASQGLYASADAEVERPPKIIKLVHGSVTYFRIIGRIGSMFRARPFLVGAEGEVVIDLAEVDRFELSGDKEWRRLLKSITGQVSSLTLVDIGESFFATAPETLTLASNIYVASIIVPYVCMSCGRRTRQSQSVHGHKSAPSFEDDICTVCRGVTRHEISGVALMQLKKANVDVPEASAEVFKQREQLLARALNDASVPQVSETATSGGEDAILGKYKIVRRISSGGLAELFLAKQIGIGGFEKPVELMKIQRSVLVSRGRVVDEFLAEVTLTGRLTHPNIVQVLDIDEVDGALMLAMEYVHGKTLQEILDRLHDQGRVMPLAEACYIVREVAQALDHAYWSTDMSGQRLAVVHGDLSPQNVMLSYDGTVKVRDFRLSKFAEEADPQYMAPELTQSPGDHRSDLFSLGVLIYELCSGQKPFTKSGHKLRGSKVRSLHDVAQVPAPISALAARLLAPGLEARPQRGQEVARELTDIARRAGFESSGANLAKFIHQMFPDEASELLPELGRRPSGPSIPPTMISRTRSMNVSRNVSRVRASLAPPKPKTSGVTVVLAIILVVLAAIAAYLYATRWW